MYFIYGSGFEWILEASSSIIFDWWFEWGRKGNLLIKAIELISDTGAHLHSITFDGTKVNTKMCEALGADFCRKTPFILNPKLKEKIYIFYDAAHMVKLIRNAFGNKKMILNENMKKLNGII